MLLEQGWQAVLQLHLSDQYFFLPTKVQFLLEVWRYVDMAPHSIEACSFVTEVYGLVTRGI